MAMNIEQRLEQSAKSIEQSSQKAHDFAEKDITLQTCAGSRDSLPKVSRIWQENFARQFSEQDATFHRQINDQATEFQNRFALSQQSLPWQAGITISDSLQRYHVGVQGEEGYKEFLPNPLKLPFETAATLADDLSQERWLENGVPNKHWTESKFASALEKSLGVNARIWPKDRDLVVGDVIPAPEDTADGLPITHVIVDGNAYAMSTLASGLVNHVGLNHVVVSGQLLILKPSKVLDYIMEVDTNFDYDESHDYEIVEGGGFTSSTPVTINILKTPTAGHYQIFFGSVVVDTPYHTSRTQNKLEYVYPEWFGAKPDAQTQATYGTPQDGTNSLGDLPSGTDSTAAINKAATIAQKASLHGGTFLELNLPCPLIFKPKGQYIISGQNPMGNQLFTAELAAMRSAADAGQDFKTIPEYQAVRFADYDWVIQAEGCVFYKIVTNQFESVIGNTPIINRLELKGKATVLPCGYTTELGGRLLHNPAIQQAGSENTNFFNFLGPFESDWSYGLSGLAVNQSGTDNVNNAANWYMQFEGYSRGDRVRVKGATIRGTVGVHASSNPESVEINYEECDIRIYLTGANLFNFGASYSQVNLSKCGIFLNGDDQTIFYCRADLFPAGFKNYTRSAKFTLRDCRIEGKDGLRKTLVDANYGAFSISDINTSLGMIAENDSSLICDLSGYATLEIKNSSIPGRAKLSYENMNWTDGSQINALRSPMLILDNCGLYNTNDIAKFEFNGKDYGFAILQDLSAGKQIPVVNFINSSNEYNKTEQSVNSNIMPPCSYYGTLRAPLHIDEFNLFRYQLGGGNGGVAYLHGAKTVFPSYSVIEDLLLSKNSSTATFNRLKLRIGTSEFFFELTNPQLKKTNESILTQRISVQTSVLSKLEADIFWVDASGVPLNVETPPSNLIIKYRAIRSRNEIPAGNISGSAVYI
ncbi:hypothetical protein [Oceanimonas smirnovii]|uniref:hypothetical protein n=1 Tax=Oceanimonas smirnovii TaxID=264574 RepID=UPI003FD6BD34